MKEKSLENHEEMLSESKQKYQQISDHLEDQKTRVQALEQLVKDNQKVKNLRLYYKRILYYKYLTYIFSLRFVLVITINTYYLLNVEF